MAYPDLNPNAMTYRDSTQGVGGRTSAANPPGKLWLPIWAGEVINAYDEYNMFEPLVTSRTIASGTTAEFPITGSVSLKASWDAGEELSGGTSTATSFVVSLDKRPMASHFEMDNVDLMLTQWEYRSELARQAALTLANARDKQLYSYLVRAATADPFANDPRSDITEAKLDTMCYGEHLTSGGATTRKFEAWGDAASSQADRSTGALSALEAIEKFIVDLQELHIPYGSLYMACSPQAFMDIRALGIARTASAAEDSQPMFGGVAAAGGLGAPYSQGLGQLHDTLEYMGCTIIKSNHVLTANASAADLGEAKYAQDFGDAKIRAVMWLPEAVAALKLQGLKVDTVDDVRRNTTFTVASMMGGTGVLRPECAAVIHGRAMSKDGGSGELAQERGALRGASYLNTPAEGLGGTT
tara:strand:+ start:4345 stop:5583 length:1239 start_codon:yes stop_codon:yes gene_type:complete